MKGGRVGCARCVGCVGCVVAAWGALFGLIGFGVYDLTNYATINNWPLALTVVDMAWGALCARPSPA